MKSLWTKAEHYTENETGDKLKKGMNECRNIADKDASIQGIRGSLNGLSRQISTQFKTPILPHTNTK